MIGTGTGAGLTAQTHGDTGGAEDHQLTIDEIPAHTHSSTLGTSTQDDLSHDGQAGVNCSAVTPTYLDLSVISVYRDVAEPNDTTSEDARFIGMLMLLTTDAADDS